MTAHFVYVRGPRGPSPQKWFQGIHNATGKLSDLIVTYQEIPDSEAVLPIETLMRIYPPPPAIE